MNGTKRNRNKKLNNSTISSDSQVKENDILANSNNSEKKAYEYVTSPGTIYINWHNSNAIYLII